MKKLGILVISSLLLSLNVFAAAVGDSVSYIKNNNRTSKLISNARGDLSIVQQGNIEGFGAGYVVRLAYELDVFLRGKQNGQVDMFVPNIMMQDDFYDVLKNQGRMNFGTFSLAYENEGMCRDANNHTYDHCTYMNVFDINHNFDGSGANAARIMRFEHSGTIESISNLEIKIKAHRDVAVLGAVELDISGQSNFGIPFKIGMDATVR